MFMLTSKAQLARVGLFHLSSNPALAEHYRTRTRHRDRDNRYERPESISYEKNSTENQGSFRIGERTRRHDSVAGLDSSWTCFGLLLDSNALALPLGLPDFAHRARCAATIFRRQAADIVRFRFAPLDSSRTLPNVLSAPELFSSYQLH